VFKAYFEFLQGNNIDPQKYEGIANSIFLRRQFVAKRIGSLFMQYLKLDKESDQLKILDIASGTGIISRHLVSLGYDISALDINKEYLKFIQNQNSSIKTIQSDMNRKLPFTSSSFDGVISIGANRFLTKRGLFRFIHEIYRILVPGGVFIWPIFFSDIMVWKSKTSIFFPTTSYALQKILQREGFVVVKKNYFWKDILCVRQKPIYLICIKKKR